MPQDKPSDQPPTPLILALATDDVEQFVIIEGATPVAHAGDPDGFADFVDAAVRRRRTP